LTDYLKAVPALTINDYNNNFESLKQQQENVEQRYQDKEKELAEIKDKVKYYDKMLMWFKTIIADKMGPSSRKQLDHVVQTEYTYC
jgi:chromosome segregation ATPase